jgi:hypothetical protein
MTLAEARHFLQCEGGALSAWDIAVRVASAAAVVGFTARAIVVGGATVWHLTLPMLAQLVAVTLSIPVLYLATPHPSMWKDVRAALRMWSGIIVAAVIALAVRCWLRGTSWQQQLVADSGVAWRWVADAHMQWPVLLAFVGELLAMPGRVRNVFRYGPPFVGVSMGCAMQFVVLIFGVFVLPWFVEGNMAWFLWWMILIAEALTLWMHLDVQRQVRKVEQRG